jgi:hypothetical protein
MSGTDEKTNQAATVHCEVCGKVISRKDAIKQGKKYFCCYICLCTWIDE